MRARRAALCLILGVVLLSSCAGSGSPDRSDPASEREEATATTATTAAAGTVGSTSTVAPSPANAPASPQVIDLVDPARPVVTNGRTISSSRSLPTTIWRPSRAGSYPLVVFAHGYRLGPPGYARFCSMLAEAGYVVAAPSFPLADETRRNGLDRGDIPNEARDVSFVISALRASPIASSISAGPVGVAGHSDGADVALIVGYQQGLSDPAVGAVVAVAPDAFTAQVSTSRPPLLLVHGDSDATVPYSESVQVFARVQGSRTFLTLVGADHLPPIADRTVWTPVLDGAVVTFFDATLKKVQSLESAQTLMRTLGNSRVQTGA